MTTVGTMPDYLELLCEYIRSDFNNVGVLADTEWETGIMIEEAVPTLELDRTYVAVLDSGPTVTGLSVGSWRVGVTVFGPQTDIEGYDTKQFCLALNRKIQLLKNQRTLAKEILGVESFTGPIPNENNRPEFLTTFRMAVAYREFTSNN